MPRTAIIKDALVENIVEADLLWDPPAGRTKVVDLAGAAKIGGSFLAGIFGEPPPRDPTMNERLASVETAVRLPAGAPADAPVMIQYTGDRWKARDTAYAAERTLAMRADDFPNGVVAVWNAALGIFEPMPKPYPQRIASGRLVLNNLTVVQSSDLAGFSSASRIAIGRYRFTFAVAQPDTNYSALPDLFDSTAVRKVEQVFAKATTHVEVTVNSLATNFPAADPGEISIIVERNVK